MVTPNTAIVYWTIPRVTYTPENYTVLYGTANLTSISSVVTTRGIANLQFITATNVSYNVTITGLNVGVQYCYEIRAININGTNYSNRTCFTTMETGKSTCNIHMYYQYL